MVRSASQRKVRDVPGAGEVTSVLVPPDAPVREVVARMAEAPGATAAFVVEEDRTLLGVLTRRDLLSWTGVQLGVDSIDAEVTWSDLLEISRARVAGDLVRRTGKPLAVTMDDTLETALLRMLEGDVTDLPVVGPEGRIEGDVRLSKVLDAAFETD